MTQNPTPVDPADNPAPVEPKPQPPTTDPVVPPVTTAATINPADLESLRNESAKYRVQRNDALRQTHALKAVLAAHNISFDVTQADLGALSIDNGAVQGEFSYTPNNPTSSAPASQHQPAGAATPAVLTKDAISKMTSAQINENWEEISKVLKG